MGWITVQAASERSTEERGGVEFGGVAHDVELSLADDQGDPARVAKITRYFTDGLRIRLLLGPYSTYDDAGADSGGFSN